MRSPRYGLYGQLGFLRGFPKPCLWRAGLVLTGNAEPLTERGFNSLRAGFVPGAGVS